MMIAEKAFGHDLGGSGSLMLPNSDRRISSDVPDTGQRECSCMRPRLDKVAVRLLGRTKEALRL